MLSIGKTESTLIFEMVAMKKNNFAISEKTRQTVHMLSGIVAVLSLVATIFLSLAGNGTFDSVSPSDKTPQPTPTRPEAIYKAQKDYAFFLDKRVFSRSVNGSTTTIRAIKNNSIKMTITPLHGTSYTKLSNDTKPYAEEIYEYAQLNVTTLYSVYQTKNGNNITTIYCIDDGLGSSIEIKYTYPSDDAEIKESFDILLSMFKLI